VRYAVVFGCFDSSTMLTHQVLHVYSVGKAYLLTASRRAQVGKDQRAQAFLGMLDNDPVVGKMVDATSYYELEADEYARKGVVRASDLLPLESSWSLLFAIMLWYRRTAPLLTHRNAVCRS